MLKQSFFGLAKPDLNYVALLESLPSIETIPPPPSLTLFVPQPESQSTLLELKEGDEVKAGQRIMVDPDAQAYTIASVAGTIQKVSTYTGDFGRRFITVALEPSAALTEDDQFAMRCDEPSLALAQAFLRALPGAPDFEPFTRSDNPIDTIIVGGIDQDILVSTAAYCTRSFPVEIAKGIEVLKQITGVANVVLALPSDIMQGYGHIGATVKAIDPTYPAGIPRLIAANAFGRVVPAGKDLADVGLAYFKAEAVVAMGRAFHDRQLPSDKILTLVDKQGQQRLVTARIGTPIGTILDQFRITLADQDRIIIGGPMTGATIYADDYPVQADTDAIMVQDKDDVPFVSDYPCINCGECVRICPVNIPVNMLVRFLEAGQYEEGAQLYDLECCIDCGLCSFVCVSKIPIFQFIKLAKYQLAHVAAEEIAAEATAEETAEETAVGTAEATDE